MGLRISRRPFLILVQSNIDSAYKLRKFAI